jgi:hypothetical protein
MNRTILNAMITMNEKITETEQQKDALLSAFATWIRTNFDTEVMVTYDGKNYTVEEVTPLDSLEFELERNIELLFSRLEALELDEASNEIDAYLPNIF